MKRGFIIAGTDTGVGKTVFSAALVSALKAYYWKPIQAGLEDETDASVVMRLGEVSRQKIIQAAYQFRTPVSPHLAARLDDVVIDLDRLQLPMVGAMLIIEMAGGLLVPLNETTLYADVLMSWQLPVILCARTTLGTINHTLLSIEAIKKRSIPVLGIVFIGPELKDTQDTICKLSGVNMLGRLPWLSELNPSSLQRVFKEHFNINDFLNEMAHG